MKFSRVYIFLIIVLLIIVAIFYSKSSLFYQRANNAKGELNYSQTLKEISWDIQGLKDKYDQVREFYGYKNADAKNLKIIYDFHTHESPKTGGWTSGVPTPNDDGVWIYFDLHDFDSKAEINNQPVISVPMCLGNKYVTFILMEGKNTKSLEIPIWTILRRHGVTECKL